MKVARDLLRRGAWAGAAPDHIALDYDARFLRRKVLVTEGGSEVLVDLAEATSLDDGDALVAEDQSMIAVRAAAEPLLEVRGDLARLAWHIGNRHTPCEVGPDRLLIRQDAVLEKMLAGLGADVTATTGPFRPEGGAYGHGRTFGHSHGPEMDHAHDHSHDHGHSHAHSHDQGHSNSNSHDHGHSHGHDHHHTPAHSAPDDTGNR